ncbi:hypothetical protein ANN_25892 [Periplaneta americana]|uniref:Uncharacterized protein n=1 Tax=Periplaneta americana TaxID=6978 RepID=A0ABQ8S4P0_PERAM|nr:hypothetical protein ANN_25892 [Periplaneta americana]
MEEQKKEQFSFRKEKNTNTRKSPGKLKRFHGKPVSPPNGTEKGNETISASRSGFDRVVYYRRCSKCSPLRIQPSHDVSLTGTHPKLQGIFMSRTSPTIPGGSKTGTGTNKPMIFKRPQGEIEKVQIRSSTSTRNGIISISNERCIIYLCYTVNCPKTSLKLVIPVSQWSSALAEMGKDEQCIEICSVVQQEERENIISPAATDVP